MLRTAPLPGPRSAARPDLSAARRDAGRDDLAAEVSAFQAEIGALEPARAAARSLADPDAAVIVTGQQPGLFGGPLLTVVKALCAIAWARRTAEESGRPVVPVFWAASEDHDLGEIARVTLLDRSDHLRTLRLDRAADGRMVADVDPGAEADVLLDALAEILPDNDYSRSVVETLSETRAPSLGTWFSRLISRWLSGEGLIVVEPRILRRFGAPVLVAERERPGAISGAIRAGPVDVAPIPFFRLEDGRRVRPASAGELPDDPEAVSWDVVTRVLAQNTIFPVAGHVVGPSEAVYCAQIAPAHAVLGLPAPPLLPRAHLTLVEGKVEKTLARFEVELAAVLEGGEEALVPRTRPEEFDAALTGVEEALAASLTVVKDQAERLDEVLLRKAEGAEKNLMKAIDRLRNQARRAMERITGTDAERRRKVLAHLLPHGEPQDRVLSPLPFFGRHGFGLIRRLLAVVEPAPAESQAVYLSGREE